jgi:catecholate siderophore receptor
VNVTGRANGYVATRSGIGKLTEDLVDTPQSITAITRAELDDRGVNSLDDAVRNAPGISLGAGEYSFQGSNIIVRGFTTRNDMFLDGMRDYGYYFRDTFNAESVEVLQGPSSILFGRGSTGGVINQTSKRPVLKSGLSGTILGGTDKTERVTLDANMLLPGLGTGAALRINAMGHESAVAGQDGGESRRWGVAPTLALGLDADTRLFAAYYHQSEDNRPDYGIPWFNGRPAGVNRKNFYGFAADYFDSDVDIGGLSVEHDLSATSGLRAQVRASRAQRDFRITEAQIPAGTPVTTLLSAITVNRLEFQGSSDDRFMQVQADWHASLHTGTVLHEVVAGLELGRERSAPVYITHVGVPGTNLAAPSVDQPYSYTNRYLRLTAHTTADSTSAYVLDTASLGEHLQLVGGLRWDRFAADYASVGYQPTGAVLATTSVSRNDQATSWRIAAIYKLATNASLYLTYGTSFNPSTEGIESLISSGRALTQSNQKLDPETSTNLEAGAKATLLGGRALASVAVFQLEKTNVRVPDPTTPGFNILGGEQRVRGFTTELAGRVGEKLEVRANYTYLDSETTKSTTGGPLVGAPLVATPRNSGSLWGTYEVTDNFRLGAGIRHSDERLGQNTAAAFLKGPGYTIFDLMASYDISNAVTVKFNIYNLGDKTYYDMVHPFHVTPGAGRSLLVTVAVKAW